MNGRGDQPGAILKRRPLPVVSARSLSSANELLIPIVFKGTGVYLVVGEESQQVYCFSSQDPEQMIDARDADALLRTGLFHASF